MTDKRRQKNNTITIVIIITFLLIGIIVAGMVFLLKEKRKELSVMTGVETVRTEAQTVQEVQESTAPGKPIQIITGDTFMGKAEASAERAVKPEITVAFAGDILFDSSYAVMSALLQHGTVPDIENGIDGELLSIMRDSDVFMVNNEFPYSDRGTPLSGKKYTFRAKPEYVSLLTDMGVDVVSLANNHINDYGIEAMQDTFDILRDEGISFVGAGNNIEEACTPFYTEIEGVKIAVVSATQIERLANPDTVGATENSAGTFRCLDPERLLDTIREAKKHADLVMVYIHWGTESETKPDWLQIEQAPQLAAAGADLIIGDHPHVLQPISCVKGSDGKVPVVYSLGNFFFNSRTMDTCLLQAVVDTETKTLKKVRFIPAVQSGCRTRLAQGADKTRILSEIQAISPGVVFDAEGGVSFE